MFYYQQYMFIIKAVLVFFLILPVPHSFQITILITDGKSQDSVQEPAQKLRSQGVHVFAVGRCLLYSVSSTLSPLFLTVAGNSLTPAYEPVSFCSLCQLSVFVRHKECRQERAGSDLHWAQQWFHLLRWGLQTAEHSSSSCGPQSVFQSRRRLRQRW